MKNQLKNIARLISSISELTIAEREYLIKKLILFFLETSKKIPAYHTLKLQDKSFPPDDLMYDLIDEIGKIDSRELAKNRRNELSGFLLYIRNEDPVLYADIFFKCCLEYIEHGHLENQSHIFPDADFMSTYSPGIFDEWVKVLLLKIISYNTNYIFGAQANVVFNPVFINRIVLRIVPELRNVTSPYRYVVSDSVKDIKKLHIQEKIMHEYHYLAELFDHILYMKNENWSLFSLKNTESYENIIAYLSTFEPYYKDSFMRLRECAFFFRSANREQFIATMPSRLVLTWKLLEAYLLTDDGLKQLHGFTWFKQMYGIQELNFG